MKKIYLDTNFLLIPAQFNVDIYEEIKNICDFQYELIVLEGSLYELNKIIREQKGANIQAAKLGLSILEAKIKEKSLYIITFSKDSIVDDKLVELTDKETYVATQDKELKRRIKDKGGKIITLRNKKILVIS